MDIDAATGTAYRDVSFEMLRPGMEIEVFWQEEKSYHRGKAGSDLFGCGS